MITRKDAIEKYLSTYPDRIVDEVFETSDFWIISGRDKDTGEEIDVSPIAINKKSGNLEVFFPPKHANFQIIN